MYADIGTSPLYTVRECFRGPAAVGLTEAHVLGVLSPIGWSLLFLVSLMCLQVILRIDNEGEGGVLALAALVSRAAGDRQAFRRRILMLGREMLIPGDDPSLAGWRRSLFRLLARNASTAPAFFGVPPDRVLEVGVQIPI